MNTPTQLVLACLASNALGAAAAAAVVLMLLQ